MSTNDSLRETLANAEAFIDDIWNDKEGRVPVDNLNRDYIDTSVRTARNMIKAAIRLAERTQPAEKKTLVVRFDKAHSAGGGPGGEQLDIPNRYFVQSISGSMAWMPGAILDESQVALLLEDESWTFTIQ